MADFVEMEIDSIRVSLVSQQQVLLLRERGGNRYLPIWIGAYEANAIQLALHEVELSRPMTHDLMKGMLETFNLKVTKVVVDNLVNNTFYATIYVVTPMGEERQIDSRPSDAIALALRMNAPIFVAKDVVERATCIEISKEEDLLKEWLEGLDPEEFEKHKV